MNRLSEYTYLRFINFAQISCGVFSTAESRSPAPRGGRADTAWPAKENGKYRTKRRRGRAREMLVLRKARARRNFNRLKNEDGEVDGKV